MLKRFNFDFNKNFRNYIIISAAVFLVGIVFNFIPGFGTKLDIEFKGGTEISFAYKGELDLEEADNLIEEAAGISVNTTRSEAYSTVTENNKRLNIAFAEDKSLAVDTQEKIETALKDKYGESNSLEPLGTRSVSASVGLVFLLKSLYVIGLAGVLVIIYIALRFRKVGGISSGVTAFIALLHDIVVAYIACVVFRLPIDSNFVAVVLTILGYSLNDTIVIFDRVREDRDKYGEKKPISELVNDSINQTLGRTVMTSVATFSAILIVVIVAQIMGIDGIRTFAIPMCIGVISGSYSTICLAGPIWVKWQEHKMKKADAKAELLKQQKAAGIPTKAKKSGNYNKKSK